MRGCSSADGSLPAILSAGLLSQCVPDLKQLSLSSCDLVDTATLHVVGKYCKNLTSLNLSGCVNVEDAGVHEVAAGCKQMQDLDLSGCTDVGDLGVLALAEANFVPGLSSLNMRGCTNVTETALSWLAERCTGLYVYCCVLRLQDGVCQWAAPAQLTRAERWFVYGRCNVGLSAADVTAVSH